MPAERFGHSPLIPTPHNACPPEWAAGSSQLDPDLVAPAGLQSYLQQALPLTMGEQAISQASPLAAGRAFSSDAAQPAVSHQVVLQASGITGRPPLHDGPISLVHPTVTELCAQAGGRLRGARDDDDAGHRTVQTVHHAGKNIAGFAMAYLEPGFGQIQKIGLVFVVALTTSPAGL